MSLEKPLTLSVATDLVEDLKTRYLEVAGPIDMAFEQKPPVLQRRAPWPRLGARLAQRLGRASWIDHDLRQRVVQGSESSRLAGSPKYERKLPDLRQPHPPDPVHHETPRNADHFGSENMNRARAERPELDEAEEMGFARIRESHTDPTCIVFLAEGAPFVGPGATGGERHRRQDGEEQAGHSLSLAEVPRPSNGRSHTTHWLLL